MKLRYLLSLVALTALLTDCQKSTNFTPLPPIVTIVNGHTDTIPRESVFLSGSAKAQGDAHIVGYIWSQVAGPSTAAIADPSDSVTTISGLTTGMYVFQLFATDNKGATGAGMDTVYIKQGYDTVTLAPANNPMEGILFGYNSADMGSNNIATDIGAYNWTVNQAPVIGRVALGFAWNIPRNAHIISAKLNLYSAVHMTGGNLVNPNYGTADSMYLQQITSSWTGSTLNWTNQPSTTTVGQIFFPATTTSQSTLDLTGIDVTAIVAAEVSAGNNYGFEVKLANENAVYTSRDFASSKETDATKHPSLTIIYQP